MRVFLVRNKKKELILTFDFLFKQNKKKEDDII